MAPPHEPPSASNATRHDVTEPVSRRQRILLYTNQRSGSSFVGSLFVENPAIFYAFEPFKLLEQLSAPPDRDHSLLIAGSTDFKHHKLVERDMSEYLLNMLNCSFTRLIADANRLQPARREQNEIRKWYGITFAKSRREHNAAPPDIQRLNDVCRTNYEHIAMKVIRGELIEHILPVLEAGVKVIHMIRDPRGVITSRMKGKRWTQAQAQRDVRLECEHNYANLKYIQRLQNNSSLPKLYDTFERNYRFVRFEDIALHTEVMTRRIYAFLDIPLPKEVLNFIDADPMVDKWNKPRVFGQQSRDKRQQKAVSIINKWRARLSRSMLGYVETQCADVMNMLGYRLVGRSVSAKNSQTDVMLHDMASSVLFAISP